jgi:surface protein
MTTMKLRTLLAFLLTIVAGLQSVKAQEAYAVYTSDNTTLTFYYDNQRSSRTGTTYDLNTGTNLPGWVFDGNNISVTRVVFNSSFRSARPTSTCSWFYNMTKLQSITSIELLDTREVTDMRSMFENCTRLTSLYIG